MSRNTLKTIKASIPDKLTRIISDLKDSEVYKDYCEVVRVALETLIAEQSRTFLRRLAKQKRRSEKELLEE